MAVLEEAGFKFQVELSQQHFGDGVDLKPSSFQIIGP